MSEVDVTKPPFNKVAIVALVFSLLSVVIWFIYMRIYYPQQSGESVVILSLAIFALAVLLDIIAFFQILLKKQRGAVLVLLSVLIPVVLTLFLLFIS